MENTSTRIQFTPPIKLDTQVQDRLFSEISTKLQELDQMNQKEAVAQSRLEQIEQQFKKTHDELLATKKQIEDKVAVFSSNLRSHIEISEEQEKLQSQIEKERVANSKLAHDLAKSVEVNLSLQLQIEELKKMARLAIDQEKRRADSFLFEKEQTQKELEETKVELEKTKTAYFDLDAGLKENLQLLQSLSETAERKIVDVQMELNQKNLEVKDLQSHLARSYQQVEILKTENLTLRNYFSKIHSMQESKSAPAPQ